MALTQGILAVVGVAATTEQISQQKKAAIEAKKARRASQRINELKEQRTRRQTIREALIARGQLENVAAQTGSVGSSAVSQARSSISSQLGSNLSFLSQTGDLTEEISKRNQRAADASGRARSAGQVADLAFKAAAIDFNLPGKSDGGGD